MARYLIRRSYVRLIGQIWLPAVTCAQQKDLTSYDVENIRDEDGKITRESVEQWLTVNAGDFQNVHDFEASIEDGDQTIDIPWQSEESELTFNDCMYPEVD